MDFEEALTRSSEKVKNTLEIQNFPHITENGTWQTTQDGYWSGGFWIGILWWMYIYTGEEIFKEQALKWLKRLEIRRISRTFDLGFIFYPSFILGYKITNDKNLKKLALEAADTQLTTYNSHLGMIYDEMIFENQKIGEIIIDIMPNLKLLWWAWKETGANEYRKVAETHSQRTLQELVRNDGSTYQGIIFNLKTSEILKKVSFQGINTESCWSRGQAWGILGFAIAFEAVREKMYLDVAKKLATYFIDHLPSDNVPFWDFHEKMKPDSIRDTSAAAIACSGFLTIYRNTGEKYYQEKAKELIESLILNYFAEADRDGIITHGCFYKQKNWGLNESLMWGDYFFIESLIQLINKKDLEIDKLL